MTTRKPLPSLLQAAYVPVINIFFNCINRENAKMKMTHFYEVPVIEANMIPQVALNILLLNCK
jgi:hypothetical protein